MQVLIKCFLRTNTMFRYYKLYHFNKYYKIKTTTTNGRTILYKLINAWSLYDHSNVWTISSFSLSSSCILLLMPLNNNFINPATLTAGSSSDSLAASLSRTFCASVFFSSASSSSPPLLSSSCSSSLS